MLEFYRDALKLNEINSISFIRNSKCKKYADFPYFIYFPIPTSWQYLQRYLHFAIFLNHYKSKLLQRKLQVKTFSAIIKNSRFLYFSNSLILIGRKNTWQFLIFLKWRLLWRETRSMKNIWTDLKKALWGLKNSYRRVLFLILRPKLYRLGTTILSRLKQLQILLS